MLSIWAMPCPSSGCFVMTKCVCQHKIVKGGKLKRSESSIMCRRCKRVHKCLASFHKHPCLPLHSGLLAQQDRDRKSYVYHDCPIYVQHHYACRYSYSGKSASDFVSFSFTISYIHRSTSTESDSVSYKERCVKLRTQ